MSKHNALDRLYDRLTSEERFKLDVEAMARGDSEESKHLASTCPKRSYTMNEVGFSGRWHGALELTLMTLLDFDGHISGSRHAWRMAGKEGEPPGWESDDEEAERNADPAIEEDLEKINDRGEDAFGFIVRALERLEREFTEEAFAQWSAYRVFCEEELELNAMKLLKAIMPQAVEYVQGLEERAARLEVEPDSKSVEEYRSIIGEVWPKYTRGYTWQGK